MTAAEAFPARRRSTESHAHRHAKRLLAQWLREAAEAAGLDGHADFCGAVGWRVNRPGPSWGVWTEYPILSDWTGLDPVWDETAGGIAKVQIGRQTEPPSFDDLIERGLHPVAILDLAIQHKGRIEYGIEVRHKHACDAAKIALLRPHMTLIEVTTHWVLGQVDRPTTIPYEFFL